MSDSPINPGDPLRGGAAGIDPRAGAAATPEVDARGPRPTPATGNSAIIDGYAEAISAVAQAEGAQQRVEDELFRFARAVETNPELRDRLSDPMIDAAAKLAVLEGLLDRSAHPQTVSAVAWLVQSGRARLIGDVAEALVRRGAAARNRTVAEVRSAVALDPAQEQRLAAAISAVTGREVEARVIVDPEVVGGVVVRVGDTVIDGSLARRLSELRARLTGG